jgi:protein-S-isoprenylcysteine O-methyltransferase Ste14
LTSVADLLEEKGVITQEEWNSASRRNSKREFAKPLLMGIGAVLVVIGFGVAQGIKMDYYVPISLAVWTGVGIASVGAFLLAYGIGIRWSY